MEYVDRWNKFFHKLCLLKQEPNKKTVFIAVGAQSLIFLSTFFCWLFAIPVILENYQSENCSGFFFDGSVVLRGNILKQFFHLKIFCNPPSKQSSKFSIFDFLLNSHEF